MTSNTYPFEHNKMQGMGRVIYSFGSRWLAVLHIPRSVSRQLRPTLIVSKPMSKCVTKSLMDYEIFQVQCTVTREVSGKKLSAQNTYSNSLYMCYIWQLLFTTSCIHSLKCRKTFDDCQNRFTTCTTIKAAHNIISVMDFADTCSTHSVLSHQQLSGPNKAN